MSNTKPAYEVESSLEGSTVLVRPPTSTVDVRFVWFGVTCALGLLAGVLFTERSIVPGVVSAVLAGGALLWGATRAGPVDVHRIELSSSRVVVDGVAIDLQSLKLTFNAERIVFRDEHVMVEVWHTVRDLEERMALRAVVENALSAARERHGAGSEEVPADLRTVSRTPEAPS